MAKASEAKHEKRTMTSLAQEAMAICDGYWEPAAEWMLTALRSDSELLIEVIDEHLPNIVWRAVREQTHGTRTRFFEVSAEEVAASNAAASERLRVHAMRSVYEWPLRRGLKLGDATREDLRAESEWHGKLSAANRRQQKWYEAIEACLPKRKQDAIVRDHVSEQKIESLREQLED